MIILKNHQRKEKVLIGNKSKDVCFWTRHPQKRIKFYCEADEAFLCTQWKKEHKGSQHSLKDFKVDVKKMKVEISNMLKDYHLRVNQLIHAKKNLGDKIEDTDSKLQTEMDKIEIHYNKMIEKLKHKKSVMIEELARSISYKSNKIKDKYWTILRQLEKLQEDWNSLNEFNNQLNKWSYEEFFRFRNLNQKELTQVGLIVESWISSWNQPDPFFQENNGLDLNLGAIIYAEYEYNTKNHNEGQIIDYTVREMSLKNESMKNLGPFDSCFAHDKSNLKIMDT